MSEATSRREPQRGDLWRHAGNGQEYLVLGRATNKDPDGPQGGLVVYRRLDDVDLSVRTVENFRERFVFVRTGESSS